MELYALDGQHTEALRQYKKCATMLETEFGVEPDTETRELRDRIAKGVLKEPVIPEGTEQPGRPGFGGRGVRFQGVRGEAPGRVRHEGGEIRGTGPPRRENAIRGAIRGHGPGFEGTG